MRLIGRSCKYSNVFRRALLIVRAFYYLTFFYASISRLTCDCSSCDVSFRYFAPMQMSGCAKLIKEYLELAEP